MNTSTISLEAGARALLPTAIMLMLLVPINVTYGQTPSGQVEGNDCYYTGADKLCLSKAPNVFTIQLLTNAGWIKAGERIGTLQVKAALNLGRGVFAVVNRGKTDREEAIDQLQTQLGSLRAFPSYYLVNVKGDTLYTYMTDEFSVRFKATVSKDDIDEMNARYSVKVLEVSKYGRYLLLSTAGSPGNALEMARIYHDSGFTEWAVPNFVQEAETFSVVPEDEFYDVQWHLEDQLPDAVIDINAPNAWLLTTGETGHVKKSDIVVAVVDDGVEQHEDFYSGQLVPGTSAVGGSPLPSTDDWHGESVAGLIAAAHNDIGVRGVTDGVSLMSVKFESENAPSASYSQVADAIDYAWENGADIINWSGGYEGLTYQPDIAEALRRARQQGRGGLGTIEIAAAGNSGGTVAFPARLDSVVSVGAVKSNNQPPDYTPRSTYVDVVAPSGPGAGETEGINLTTTDRMGAAGHGDLTYQNYTFNFSGTSGAAPQVSGIAALILSVFPAITESEVRDIILDTANDYGFTV